MASIRKIKDKWLAEVRINGKYQSRTHGSKNEAKAWATETEHKFVQNRGILQGKTFADAFTRYVEEETPKKKGARWETFRIQNMLKDPIANIILSDLHREDFNGFIKRRKDDGLKGSSINRELEIMSAVISRARDFWQWVEGTPMKGIDRPDNPPPRNKTINDVERQNILLALEYHETRPVITIRQRIAVGFLLAIETGMRYGEIWNMQWQHINWIECFVHLPETKNGTARDVSLSKRAVELLLKLGKKEMGSVVNTHSRSSEVIFRRSVEIAGYKGFITFHDTRHTAITWMAKKLTNPLDLARQSGHKNIKQLMTYYNPTPKSIAEQLD